MAEQDDGRRENRFLVVNQNEVVALVLPHQIRNGLHLQIDVAGKQSTNNPDDGSRPRRACRRLEVAMRASYLKKAMRRLTMRMYWTKR